jgi:hypothetical protein
MTTSINAVDGDQPALMQEGINTASQPNVTFMIDVDAHYPSAGHVDDIPFQSNDPPLIASRNSRSASPGVGSFDPTEPGRPSSPTDNHFMSTRIAEQLMQEPSHSNEPPSSDCKDADVQPLEGFTEKTFPSLQHQDEVNVSTPIISGKPCALFSIERFSDAQIHEFVAPSEGLANFVKKTSLSIRSAAQRHVLENRLVLSLLGNFFTDAGNSRLEPLFETKHAFQGVFFCIVKILFSITKIVPFQVQQNLSKRTAKR